MSKNHLPQRLALAGLFFVSLFIVLNSMSYAAGETWVVAGTIQSPISSCGDWDNTCAETTMTDPDGDSVHRFVTDVLPDASYEYKIVEYDNWDNAHPDSNVALTTDGSQVIWYMQDDTYNVADNVNQCIATAVGSFQSSIGGADWAPENLRTMLWQESPGSDLYTGTFTIPAGNWEYKVARNEKWDESYPGSNVAFSLTEETAVTFTYNCDTNEVNHSTDAPPSDPEWVVAGSFQSAWPDSAACGDWNNTCVETGMEDNNADGVYRLVADGIPAGSYAYKVVEFNNWNNAHPGSDVGLTTDGSQVRWYFEPATLYVADNVNNVIATAAGTFQGALGCSGDWQPECLRSMLKDADGDGIYTFSSNAIPAGDHNFKVALNEGWAEAYPANDVPFNVPNVGDLVTITFDTATNDVGITVDSGGGLEPGDELLVRSSLRTPLADEVFYFVMPDRFENGDSSNDDAGTGSTDPLVHGLLPTDKGYYHGGDLAGLQAKLDYLQSLGVTAVWLTPQFTNNWVQGDGTIDGSTAAYHGYWQIDYTQIDPHFGTNEEMKAFIADAQSRGMKVFFDIVLNHTGDVISYEEGVFNYRNKTDFPYRDANGNEFDDRDYAGTDSFPPLDPATSFPYTPTFPNPGDDTAKNPAWLNNSIYYHNRGDSTFSGESSLYGDFFGLDDLFTEHPDVVNGMIDIHKSIITEFSIDGFRVDTVKHVNDEMWEAFVPAIQEHATNEGITDFFIFGEVFSGDQAYASRFTTELPFPSLLDFGFDGAAKSFAANSNNTDQLRDFFAADDYYTDDDSNAYSLVKFIGNHDIGRFGNTIDSANPGAEDAERVARARLGYALSYFSRGIPLVYYGDEQGFTGDGGDKDARQDMMPSLVPSYNDDDLIGTDATTADANFDETHPLFQSYSDFAQLRDAHAALRQGVQIHRYSEASAGIYAFSRIDPTERVEYLVVLNNSESADSATFTTGTPNATFNNLIEVGPVAADASGDVTINLDGLSFAVYQADTGLPLSDEAPSIVMSNPAANSEVIGRIEVAATVGTDAYAEVTFAVSIDGGDYAVIGTDDNAPYRVFYDTSTLPNGTALTFKAIVNDLNSNLNADKVAVTVGEEVPPPPGAAAYAVIHYLREDGDYGDHTTGDYNDFWGLHLWGDIDETIEWTSPKPFLGEDDYGRFAWVKLAPNAENVGFIVHRGDTKDGTDADRFFNPSVTPEIWLKQDDANTYTSQAEAQGFVTVHYHRDDGDYGDPSSSDYNDYWGLHLWGDAIDPSEGTDWTSPKPPTGFDDFGAYWTILVQDVNQPVNFIIHRGDNKDPGPDQSFIPVDNASIWIQSGDETIYPSLGAAENTVYLRYHRADGDYGDYTSTDFNDFWGMHVWTGAANPNPSWQEPVKPESVGLFGPEFQVPLTDDATELAYILHRGDEKDPGVDQFLNLDKWGFEVWQLEGEGPEHPDEPHYVLPLLAGGGSANPGNINVQSAYWVDEKTILWNEGDNSSLTYTLHFAEAGGLEATDAGITGGDFITLGPGTISGEVAAKFPHLAGLPALEIAADDLATVPDILKGQIAVSAVTGDGQSVDATGLQIPGVLDDLYTYNGELGVTWDGDIPAISVWAPTAKNVDLHLFDDADPATASTVVPMSLDAGVWRVVGQADWKNKFYLFDVEVYVHSTGQVEHNLVTDPYSLSLSMNSKRSQIVDLGDGLLMPSGWTDYAKPELVAPEDISIYEIHVRDFSVNDPTVPEELQGTFKAFTLNDTNGMGHLEDLEKAGLSHLHLLPVFDIATINENKAEWQEADWVELASYPPDSEEQQVLITQYEDLDGFNWGYDPFHYTVPEGSYSTHPDGSTRIVEFREMVQSVNEMGLRVVMDVVYNHTNASGQDEKSVLDRIVPGYYHRLNDKGQVETSTCCQNTASEHAMMEKLMVDSLVTWAKAYKVDAFRFDLMGHHMVSNMVAVREALDTLTLEDDGVDGKSIYLYGEGWNFGEVADNARGVNATQLNVGGLGIGTFSDRLRDAVRGGGPFDNGEDLIRNQGFANGLYYDPNALNSGSEAELDRLLLSSDQIRVGMAGNLAEYTFEDRNGNIVMGSEVDYNGQPAGYTLDPQEDITYISKHDNQTLYDNNTYKNPVGLSMADRARVQNVGLSTVLLGQGVPFMHAGSDLMRSKSLDRDSYNSGDWFNKLDFSYQENNFGVGLPVAGKNQDNWGIMQPLLANPALQPAPGDIAFSAALFQELLAIRDSSPLFRLQTAAEIQERVAFHNTGPTQHPGMIVMTISDLTDVDLDRYHEFIVVAVNANDEPQLFTDTDLVGLDLVLHPVQIHSVDDVVKTVEHDPEAGSLWIPARTTAVFVVEATASELIDFLIEDVEALVEAGELSERNGDWLIRSLERAQFHLENGRERPALNQIRHFYFQVELLKQLHYLDHDIAESLQASAVEIYFMIR